MRIRWALLFVTTTGFAGAGEPAPTAAPAALARLVERLGSRYYRERESAAAALVAARSPAAVELLRRAAASGDAEVRRRAAELLDQVERLVETERLLRPQCVRLAYKDTPVAEAVVDLAGRTGLPLVLNDADRAKVQKRTVTLRTEEVPVWEALRLLCEKAGLAERPPEIKPARPPSPYGERAVMGRGQQIVWLDGRQVQPNRNDNQIVLVDGTGRRPTCVAGALRIQALTGAARAEQDGRKSVAPEVAVALNVDTEPRFGWNRLVSVRVDRAVDDRGQRLWQPEVFVGDEGPWNPYAMPGEVIVVWDGTSELPSNPSRQALVRLRLGERPAKAIRELRGTLVADVEAPAQPLVVVDDVLKAAGKTVAGPEGSAVKVAEVKREPSGQYRLKVEVRGPPRSNDFASLPNVRVLRINQKQLGGLEDRRGLSAKDAANRGLALLDAKGAPVALVAAELQPNEDARAAQVYTLYFERAKGQGEPARFVFSGRRRALLEVPFVLENVPLP